MCEHSYQSLKVTECSKRIKQIEKWRTQRTWQRLWSTICWTFYWPQHFHFHFLPLLLGHANVFSTFGQTSLCVTPATQWKLSKLFLPQNCLSRPSFVRSLARHVTVKSKALMLMQGTPTKAGPCAGSLCDFWLPTVPTQQWPGHHITPPCLALNVSLFSVSFCYWTYHPHKAGKATPRVL